LLLTPTNPRSWVRALEEAGGISVVRNSLKGGRSKTNTYSIGRTNQNPSIRNNSEKAPGNPSDLRAFISNNPSEFNGFTKTERHTQQLRKNPLKVESKTLSKLSNKPLRSEDHLLYNPVDREKIIYGRNQKTDCDQGEKNGCEGNSMLEGVGKAKPMLPVEGSLALRGGSPPNASSVENASHASTALPKGQAQSIAGGEGEVSPGIASRLSQSASTTGKPTYVASAPPASQPELSSAATAPRAGQESTKKTKREGVGKKHQPGSNLQNARRIIPAVSEARPGREAASMPGFKDREDFLTLENALQTESKVAKDFCPKEQWPLKNPWADLAGRASRKNQPPATGRENCSRPAENDLPFEETHEPSQRPEWKKKPAGRTWDAERALEEAEIEKRMDWFRLNALSALAGIVETTQAQVDYVIDREREMEMIPGSSPKLLEWLTDSLLMEKFRENKTGDIDCHPDLNDRAVDRVQYTYLESQQESGEVASF
jgi:hypothetical protein